MKILLAIDGSEFSQAAVDQLAKMPFSPQTEVRIMSVFANSLWTNTPEVTITGGTLDKYYDQAVVEARKSAQEVVTNAAQVIKAKNASLSVITTVVDGLPKNAILDEAKSYGVDLIVVGSHGHNALSRFLLGSVSHFVSLYAHCSVMIVRKGGMNH